MAFPWLSEAGFEDGSKGHFDVETDTENRLDFPHYSALANVPGLSMPYRGAYCMRVELANDGTPADALVQETGSWDTSAAGTIFFRLMFWVSPTITMANTDEFAILQLWSGTNTPEGGAYINFTTANGLRIGIGETAATSFLGLSTGVWHCLELKFLIDSGAPNDGTIDGWLDNIAFTQVTALDQGVITSGVVGSIGQDAGTTKGVVLFDDIIADDARIGPVVDRYKQSQQMTASGHAFIGPGTVTGISLIAGAATDNTVSIYDTDTGYTTDSSNIVYAGGAAVASTTVDLLFNEKIEVRRGAYVVLGGTNPRANVRYCNPVSLSDGSIRTYASRRKPGPFGA